MENLPLISVIIPAYNAQDTILRACESVLEQSHPHLELIVVNDGSKDNTGKLLDEIAAANGNVRCIHQENGGVCKARNAGLRSARGEYLFFLDADDALVPQCLEKLLQIAMEKSCAIVAGPCIEIKPDGTQVPSQYHTEAEVDVWRGKEGLRQSLLDNPATYSVWGKLYRRDAIAETWFVEGKRIHEDSFFLFEALTREKDMAVSNVHSVFYYVTENSASRAVFSDRFLDILYFAERKLQITEEKYPQFHAEARNMLVKANMALLKAMPLAVDNRYRDVEKQCIRAVIANGQYFTPAIPIDRILILFIRLRMFWLYKQLYRLLRR